MNETTVVVAETQGALDLRAGEALAEVYGLLARRGRELRFRAAGHDQQEGQGPTAVDPKSVGIRDPLNSTIRSGAIRKHNPRLVTPDTVPACPEAAGQAVRLDSEAASEEACASSPQFSSMTRAGGFLGAQRKRT